MSKSEDDDKFGSCNFWINISASKLSEGLFLWGSKGILRLIQKDQQICQAVRPTVWNCSEESVY
jgi:hypothetical protein